MWEEMRELTKRWKISVPARRLSVNVGFGHEAHVLSHVLD